MRETLIVMRCAWALSSQQYLDYHDKEWGVPVHDDRKLFEMMILEGVQAGLSWSLILKKRAGYFQAFDDFDAHKIARYDDQKIQELLANPEIVRNRLKIQATIQNARAFLAIQSLCWLHGSSVQKIGSFETLMVDTCWLFRPNGFN
jgi:DNA-3-methyladenine glycosylase I